MTGLRCRLFATIFAIFFADSCLRLLSMSFRRFMPLSACAFVFFLRQLSFAARALSPLFHIR
jgi:hypothetical protein